MPTVAIIADSGCDLPADIVERFAIDIVPLVARFGTYELMDTPETRQEFWELYDISQPPQSSGPSVGAWSDAYQKALQRADEVITVTLTSKHSGTFNGASVAAADFDGRVHVFDSWSLSLGEGLLTARAARLAQAGQSAEAILSDLSAWRERLRVYIVLDTVEAVQRGGRLGPVISAIKRVSALFSIKPLLALKQGTINFDGAFRSRKKGMKRIVSTMNGQQIEAAAVAHTRAPELAERLADASAAASNYPRSSFIVAEAGPALAVHGGPGALGLAYIPAALDPEAESAEQ